MRRILRLLAASITFSLATPYAVAHDSQPPPATDASVRFDRGIKLYREGDYAAALIEFKHAYDLSPNWQVLFNIGQSYFQLHDYSNALVTLQRFATEGGDRIGEEDRATLDAELPDLAGRVGRVTIISNLAGAKVSVDDQPVGATPLRDPVLVGAGTRQITAEYSGRAPVQQRVAIGGGDNVTLHLDFLPLAASPQLSRGVALANRPRSVATNAVPTYLTFLLAGGGVAVGSLFGVRAINDRASLDRVCTPSGACPATSQSDINSLMRDATFSTVGFGVGIAGFFAGVAFWIAARSSSATTESSQSTSSRSRGTAGDAPSLRLQIAPGLMAGSF